MASQGSKVRLPGMVVSVFGVDGSGKTTLIEGLERSLGPSFTGVERWHFLQPLRPGAESQPMTEPHGRAPRSLAMSTLKLLWYLSKAWLVRAPAIARSVRAGRLVLIDRDLHDLWLDPLRFRLERSALFGGPAAIAIPRPNLALVLDADVGTIAARSREVDADFLPRLLQRYRTFADANAWVELVDASVSPAGVVAAATHAVLSAREAHGRSSRPVGAG